MDQNLKGSQINADCVILTALKKELDSVLKQFRGFKLLNHIPSSNTFYQTTTPNGLTVIAGVSTGMGALAAANLTKEAVLHFNPKAILLVGIAGGMDRGIPLGDVVVSEQIVDYELGKITADGPDLRWSVYRPNAKLLSRAISWQEQSWQSYIHTPKPSGNESPQLHSGVYLSGNKVIASEEAAGSLRSVWSKAAAIEMEASGVASVLWNMENAPAFLVIKSICDYADASKNDEWQQYCSDSAASCAFSFVLEYLEPNDFIFPPSPSPQNSGSRMDDRLLRETLQAAYSRDQLKVLCFDLKEDWDEINPGPKSAMIVELVTNLRRVGKFDLLVELVNRDRDGILNSYQER